MLAEINPILLLIIAGLCNGSFVIPSKYIKNANNDQIWLGHAVIGLAIIPWLILFIITPNALYIYGSLPATLLLFLAISGVIFGFGQIWFAQSIQLLGVALSFAINLGIGVIIGSMFVIFYESAFLTMQGFLGTLAVFLIFCSLVFYYLSGKVSADKNLSADYKPHHTKGWILASLAGLTSGLQNITFIMVIFQAKTQLQTNDSFWIWPVFLLASAIPMFFVFKQKIKNNQKSSKRSIAPFLTVSNLLLIILMGLLFTASLAFYSLAMSQLNDQEKIIGWPVFMLSIIIVSQIWGILYKEAVISTFKNKLYRFFSLALLIIAIIILALKP